MAEFEFIDWLRAELAAKHAPNRRLGLPPGDDCAIAGGRLFAADMIMEGVHFDLSKTTPRLAGRKALAVNLSDIAAMAGTPTSVTVCLALPKKSGTEVAKEVMHGIIDLAAEFDVAVAGGDTNSWNGPLVISVAILGTPHPQGSVTRAGAKLGDKIFVTGPLGGSISGKHLTFTPRVKEAQQLHSRYGLTSMIDLSDGLGSDLRHILAASGVGARLDRSAIPIASGAAGLGAALCDGEDFELCFTSPIEKLEVPFPLYCIGEIQSGDLVWDDGFKVTERGYRHELD